MVCSRSSYGSVVNLDTEDAVNRGSSHIVTVVSPIGVAGGVGTAAGQNCSRELTSPAMCVDKPELHNERIHGVKCLNVG